MIASHHASPPCAPTNSACSPINPARAGVTAGRRIAPEWAAFFLVAVVLALSLPARGSAQEFALAASPPRFELSTKPGETVRGVVELDNASSAPAAFAFATADWTLSPGGGVAFQRGLAVDSCRPWVAIERREATIPGNGRMRYRFEVTPPAGTPPRECRFAITVTGNGHSTATMKGASIAIGGEVAIIVYVEIGNVKPDIHIVKADVASINGMPSPVLMVENSGTAHGRLTALLSGTDARGRRRDFTASSLPILPGETRIIALNVDEGDDAIASSRARGAASSPAGRKPEAIAFPLKIKGTISDTVSSFHFEGVFAP